MTDRDSFCNNFPITAEINVQWGEMDAFGHVNNVIYLRYFETARIAYLRHVAATGVLDMTRVLPVLSETQCRYLRPVRFPDTLLVGCTVTEVHEHGITQDYEIFSTEQGKVVSTGIAKIVLLDKQSQRKALVAPELHEQIKLIEAME
ncbi:acyl-CoA thioesterase [Gilvimarinus agarilyticus]|uniref:acyl-CoA thioesterase n=1 Tax=unclassified Gilvimarinus TaxID=2642066 RepID=UPI001C0886AF|nr:MULTISPECIES: acyl-CoA thioesterase [unclassified Gilvimarinus]MBU2885924.1 acyl-CoA thioesterase [Gilvimarinus agarilyticus]MDO6570670.1 acyl-CoA thioesterase [Gilvimarinus sp. 2_MG-2023]MDO6747739.1 acyl-CoA thioesterase [Gilvimarinus sp. 1_MG-2023]